MFITTSMAESVNNMITDILYSRYVPLQACMHKLPVGNERGTKWPEAWPQRLQKVPEWLKDMQGGEQLSQDFAADNERWKNVIDELSNIGVSWSHVRNIMDMRASYGG